MKGAARLRSAPILGAGSSVLSVALVLALVVAYVFAYVFAPLEGSRTWIVAVLVAVLAAIMAMPLVWVRRQGGSDRDRPMVDAALTVAVMLLTLVLGFSAIYVTLANESSANLPGLETRLDAVYFTVTTLATVGFGDITADSQSARIVVTVQMIFDLTVVAVAVRLILGVARERRQVHLAPP